MKLIFAGTPQIAADALEKLSRHHEIVLVLTREDAPVGRKRVLTPSPVAQVASDLGIPVLKQNRLGSGSAHAISSSGAELGIVIAFGALIPKDHLALMPWWNLHFSLLPKWRGASPLQHSMMHLGDGGGISLFELEAGLDTGPLIDQKAIDIDYSKTAGEHLVSFTTIGIEMILQSLESRPASTPQSGDVSLAPKLDRAMARLDLSSNADLVAAKVMALNPEPMAWVNLDGEPIRILRAKSMGSTDWAALDNTARLPGRVTQNGGRVLLECGSGTKVELLTLQPSGKKEMSAGDWYRGLSKEVVLG